MTITPVVTCGGRRRRGARRLGAALAAVTAALASCTSGGPADRSIDATPQAGDVLVRGVLVAPDQRVVSGRQVSAVRVTQGRDLLADLFTTVFTGGLAVLGCLGADGPLEVCRQGDYTTQTTTGGTFGFRLRASDVTAGGGGRRALDIATGLAPAAGEVNGPIVSVRVEPKPGDTSVALGKLTAWDGTVAATASTDAVSLRWADTPGTGRVAVRLEESARGFAVSDESASRPAVLDARLLEDANPTLTVTSHGRINGRDAVWTSAGRRVTGSAGAPVSRAAACAVTIGTAAPIAAGQGCWVDDGQFAAAPTLVRPTSCRSAVDSVGFAETTCVRAPITAVTLDLGVSIPLSLLVLRGSSEASAFAPAAVAVEGSSDLTRWRLLGTWDGRPTANPLELVPPAGSSARYVRLRVDGQPRPQPSFADEQAAPRQDPRAVAGDYRGDLASVAELSVWKGSPRPVAGVLQRADRDRRTRTVLIVVAALLGLGIAVGVGYAAGRRRHAG